MKFSSTESPSHQVQSAESLFCKPCLPKQLFRISVQTKVPEDSFFVIGDNLEHSLDSRFPEFGLVASNQLRGKALFLYWSSRESRIGCPIR